MAVAAQPRPELGDSLPELKTSKLKGVQILAARKAPLEQGAIRLAYALVVFQFARSLFIRDWCVLRLGPDAGTQKNVSSCVHICYVAHLLTACASSPRRGVQHRQLWSRSRGADCCMCVPSLPEAT